MYKNNSGLDVYERHEIINQLIKARGYKDYLEVGTDKGDTFSKIEIKNKECCDPINNISKEYNFKLDYQMKSDEMFENMPKNKKYDIIFLDGMHDEKYLELFCHIPGERFEYETNMLLRCIGENVAIKEITIETVYLDENKATHFRPVRDSVRIYRFLIKKHFLYFNYETRKRGVHQFHTKKEETNGEEGTVHCGMD